MEKQKPKYRHIHFFECIVCHKKRRSSLSFKKAQNGVCKKCQKIEENKNQMRLFELEPEEGLNTDHVQLQTAAHG